MYKSQLGGAFVAKECVIFQIVQNFCTIFSPKCEPSREHLSIAEAFFSVFNSTQSFSYVDSSIANSQYKFNYLEKQIKLVLRGC